MEAEAVGGNSSEESEETRASEPTRRSKKRKGGTGVMAPSNTLTRFLGPSGPLSRNAWEDVNRQCPVCQRKGFSSRALALHVNDCLDVAGKTTDNGPNSGGEDCGGQTRSAEDKTEHLQRPTRMPSELSCVQDSKTDTEGKPGRSSCSSKPRVSRTRRHVDNDLQPPKDHHERCEAGPQPPSRTGSSGGHV